MKGRYLFKTKRVDNGKWVEGYIFKLKTTTSDYKIEDRWFIFTGDFDTTGLFPNFIRYEIEPKTICQYTGLTDKNNNKIWENDICKLILPTGEIRHFKVSFKSIKRNVVNYPDFVGETSKVEITGIVFKWQEYDLLPCIDTYGKPDYKEMKVVGNAFDNYKI